MQKVFKCIEKKNRTLIKRIRYREDAEKKNGFFVMNEFKKKSA